MISNSKAGTRKPLQGENLVVRNYVKGVYLGHHRRSRRTAMGFRLEVSGHISVSGAEEHAS
jgi:hypothetical protein